MISRKHANGKAGKEIIATAWANDIPTKTHSLKELNLSATALEALKGIYSFETQTLGYLIMEGESDVRNDLYRQKCPDLYSEDSHKHEYSARFRALVTAEGNEEVESILTEIREKLANIGVEWLP